MTGRETSGDAVDPSYIHAYVQHSRGDERPTGQAGRQGLREMVKEHE